MRTRRTIFCCGCGVDVEARLTSGRAIYPHRPDLYALPFWRCPTCENFVGCHHKTTNRTRPLGVIADRLMKAARIKIHAILDPLWKEKLIARRELYMRLTSVLGREYHTAELRTLDEATAIHNAVMDISRELRSVLA